MKKIQKLLHDWLGWGYPIEEIDGDHFQSVFSCRFCPGHLTTDSNGDWFHLN